MNIFISVYRILFVPFYQIRSIKIYIIIINISLFIFAVTMTLEYYLIFKYFLTVVSQGKSPKIYKVFSNYIFWNAVMAPECYFLLHFEFALIFYHISLCKSVYLLYILIDFKRLLLRLFLVNFYKFLFIRSSIFDVP